MICKHQFKHSGIFAIEEHVYAVIDNKDQGVTLVIKLLGPD